MASTAAAGTGTTRRRRRIGASESTDSDETMSFGKMEASNVPSSPSRCEFDKKHFKGSLISPAMWREIRFTVRSLKESRVLVHGSLSFVVLLGLVRLVLHHDHSFSSRRPTYRKDNDTLNAMPVSLPYERDDVPPFRTFQFHGLRRQDENIPDFGEIEVFSLQDQPIFSRRINPWDYETHDGEVHEYMEEWDEPYFPAKYDPDEDIQDTEHQCRRNNWRSRRYPNCNAVHEITVARPPTGAEDLEIKYLGSGHFRNAWLFQASHSEFVYKRLKLNDEFEVDHFDMHKIHREAIIMERLTHSPRIIDIFGFCSTTILSEAMGSEVWHDIIPGTGHARQVDLDRLDDVYPRNKFTPTEKLEMSLEMAEAIADIHGFEGGVFLHGDVHPEQWLRAKDGSLKLNDFNNAEILDYDEENEQYCNEWRQYGGFYRAPEEYPGLFINEAIDTFALGNNIYCLLTGLWPFYEWSDYETIQRMLLSHQRAYVDPRYRYRSFAEAKMVEIMEQTWEFDPSERIDVFEVVKFLRKAVAENRQRLPDETASRGRRHLHSGREEH